MVCSGVRGAEVSNHGRKGEKNKEEREKERKKRRKKMGREEERKEGQRCSPPVVQGEFRIKNVWMYVYE